MLKANKDGVTFHTGMRVERKDCINLGIIKEVMDDRANVYWKVEGRHTTIKLNKLKPATENARSY